jgi:hypothetical protein
VSHEGDEVEVTETAPISKVMRQSSLVVSEEPVAEGTLTAKAEGISVGEGSGNEDEDYTILIPEKPSHLDFGKSIVTADDMVIMKNLGYFGEAESRLVRSAGEEVVPEPKDDEVIVFKSFFRAGLWFPLYDMIGEVLKNFEIYLHQLTPNAIVRLSVYIWALRSQGMSPNAEAFCRVHELHYQTMARADGLHENFGCYNFVYWMDTKAPVLSYRTKWPTGWKSEWFYMKADKKKRQKLMSMVMSPLSLSFGMMRPLCHMQLGSPCQVAKVEFRVVAVEVSTRDSVQEFLANRAFSTSSGWGMPKKKDASKKHELVRLPYWFKFEKEFKKPCQEWLEMIETMCNEILGNYTKKEDQKMIVAFGTRPKRRLNRVMNALDFEHPDYERFDKGAEGLKRKRVVSILNRQAGRLVKEDEKIAKKTKSAPEPKATVSKKRKPEVPEPKVAEAREETPTPSDAEVAEILKVMTESLPIQLLSSLRPELTELLQKKDQPSAIKENPRDQKRQRIVNVMHVIERTPPRASASRIMHVASTEAETTTEAGTTAEAAAAAEDANLVTTMSGIDKLISGMIAEETVVTA